MREKDFLSGRKSDAPPPASMASISILPANGYQKLLEAIDRADEMEDAMTLGRDCACHNNDPNCTECWDDPIKFKIVKDHKGNLIAGPKKASNAVSNNANLVYARELEITAVTTVSELYEMIDLPYRITKHAKVSIQYQDGVVAPILRLQWHGEGE